MISSPRTLVLFALLATVPFLPTGMLLLRATQAEIETTQKEIKGITLHKNLYALLASHLGLAPRMDIDAALQENRDALNARPSLFLNPTQAAAFSTEMESLFGKSGNDGSSRENIIRFMRKVGDRSTLILDPELATYYLVDILVNIIPASLAALEGPEQSPQSAEAVFRTHAELAHLQNSLQWALARIDEGTKSPGQKESVASLQAYSHLCAPLLDQLDLAAKGLAGTSLQGTSACASELGALYSEAGKVLKKLLQLRLRVQEQNKTILLLLLVFSYFTFTLISALAWENYVRKKDVLAARELIEAQTRLKLAVAGARDGIWDWPDTRREAQYWSPQFKNLLGYSEDGIEATASHFFALLHPDDKSAFMQAVSTALGKGQPLDCECRLRCQHGAYQWFQIKALASHDEDDAAASRLSGSITDIETRKTLENQKSHLIARLEQTNDELEKFAHIASHDLKEPLRTMASFAGLLAQKYKDGLDEKARSYIVQIQAAAQRMQNLINDLLDYAKLNHNIARRELVDTHSEVQNVIRELSRSVEEHNAKITLDALPKIHTNAARFSSVMQNLISNAIKYGKAEVPPVITISSSDQGAFWRFEVADNGIGIAADATAIIFEPFRRLHSQQEYEGTGIGLAMCKRMVESLGGSIGVESVENKGSRFFFTLPK